MGESWGLACVWQLLLLRSLAAALLWAMYVSLSLCWIGLTGETAANERAPLGCGSP